MHANDNYSVCKSLASWKRMPDIRIFQSSRFFKFTSVNSVMLLWHSANVEIYHFRMTYTS